MAITKRPNGKWRAQIMINYKSISLGDFNIKEEAKKAYDDACIKYGLEKRMGWLNRNKKRDKNKYYSKCAYDNLRAEILDNYGNVCACCGENNPEFLTLDHINENGAKHRKEIGRSAGANFYKWIRANNFPKDNFQLLCYNCNCAKHRFGYCPHKLNRYQG